MYGSSTYSVEEFKRDWQTLFEKTTKELAKKRIIYIMQNHVLLIYIILKKVSYNYFLISAPISTQTLSIILSNTTVTSSSLNVLSGFSNFKL